MIFGLKAVVYNWEKYSTMSKAGVIVQKVSKGKCSNCKKKIPDGVMIITQTYSNRFGGGVHKFCPECSEAGVKELKEATKEIRFRAKIGWDNY